MHKCYQLYNVPLFVLWGLSYKHKRQKLAKRHICIAKYFESGIIDLIIYHWNKMNTLKTCSTCIHRKYMKNSADTCGRLVDSSAIYLSSDYLVSGKHVEAFKPFCFDERYASSITAWLFNKCGKNGKYHKAII